MAFLLNSECSRRLFDRQQRRWECDGARLGKLGGYAITSQPISWIVDFVMIAVKGLVMQNYSMMSFCSSFLNFGEDDGTIDSKLSNITQKQVIVDDVFFVSTDAQRQLTKMCIRFCWSSCLSVVFCHWPTIADMGQEWSMLLN